jgi:hypothetical protein
MAKQARATPSRTVVACPGAGRGQIGVHGHDMVLVMLVVVLMAAVELFNTKKMVNGDKFDECGL